MKTTEEKRAYAREYYTRNKKRFERYRNEYYRANREQICQRKRARYALDPDFRARELARHRSKRLAAEVRPDSPDGKENGQQ